MIYKFLNFYLDIEKKELYFQQKKIHLTQQNFKLLKVFLENSGRTINKEQLIKEVWNDRIVEDNTIDQAFSKLRKLLNSKYQSEYFAVGYGKGWSFLHKVSNAKIKSNNLTLAIMLVGVIILSSTFYYAWIYFNKHKDQALIMFIPQESQELNQWWTVGSSEIIENFLGKSHQTLIKEYQASVKDMIPEDYLQYLWTLSPELNVISSKIDKNPVTDAYQLTIEVESLNKNPTYKAFSHKSIKQVYKDASEWVASVYGIKLVINDTFPNDDQTTELFLQGMKNLKIENYDKSINYFKLSLQEAPNFNLARIKLAEAYKNTSQFDQALIQLETIQLGQNEIPAQLNLIGLKGDIYEIQGKHKLAKELYEQALSRFNNIDHTGVNEIRFYLSDVYFSLADNIKALEQLDLIEREISSEKSPYLLADTYRQQGQIHFINGDFVIAEQYTQKALNLYTDLGYVTGQIKAFASLSRFFQHQHQYALAIGYINKSLALSRVKGNKLLIGATINQLIYLLNTQGKNSEAWEMTQELENIGLEIGYTRMVIAAKHHFAELARHQKKFQLAKANLDEHLILAKNTDNKRAIHTNDLLMLDYLLDQNLSEGVQTLIDKVQKHIEATHEIRLLPIVNLQQAKLNVLNNQNQHVIELLNNAIEQAKKTEDGETIVMINNFLAKFYIIQSKPEKALHQLNMNIPFHPSPKPYLLIRAKIFQQKGEYSKALELVNQCKLESNESWFSEDQQFLNSLQSQLAKHK